MTTPRRKFDQALSILQNYVLLSMGIALIPLPLFDLAGLWGLQLVMLRVLSELYGENFSDGWARKSVATLLGGLTPFTFFVPLFSVMRVVPVLGYATAALGMPILAGAATYAVGIIFIRHFESGGTIATFDAAAKKELFRECYEEGKQFAAANRSEAETASKQNQSAAATGSPCQSGGTQTDAEPKADSDAIEGGGSAVDGTPFDAGSDIEDRAHASTLSDMSMVDLAHPLPSPGEVTRWVIWAEHANLVQLLIYRRVGDAWSVVGESEIQEALVGPNKFELPTPIEVQAGDYIGWYFPETGVISFDKDSGGWGLGDLSGTVLWADGPRATEFQNSGNRTYSISVFGTTKATEPE